MDLFFSAFTPVALVAAILGGLFTGYFVLGWLVEFTRKAIKQEPQPSPVKTVQGLALVSFLFGIPFVAGFYVPQLFAAIADNDQLWPRLAGRAFIAVIYLAGYSLGLAYRLRHTLTT